MPMSERIHLVLHPELMKAFRNMAKRGFRSNSSQFALLVEQEMNRQSESEIAEAPREMRGD